MIQQTLHALGAKKIDISVPDEVREFFDEQAETKGRLN